MRKESADAKRRRLVSFVLCSLAACFALCVLGCSKSSDKLVDLRHYPIDSMEGIITRSSVEIDEEISSDDAASLRVTVAELSEEPTVIRLFETGDIDVENATLVYQAKVRTEDVQGQVFLEMWCHFPGRGEFFSRGLMSALTGSCDWTTQETPFFLKEGENPDNVKLNLVIVGKGTAWIDDVRLSKGPLG